MIMIFHDSQLIELCKLLRDAESALTKIESTRPQTNLTVLDSSFVSKCIDSILIRLIEEANNETNN